MGEPRSAQFGIVESWVYFHFISLHDIMERDYRRTKNGGMKKLSVADYQALAEFRYQIRKFLHFSDAALRGRDWSGAVPADADDQRDAGGSAAADRELADRMQIQHHSAVELIEPPGGRRIRAAGAGAGRPARGVAGAHAKGRAGAAQLALHHHEELQNAAPELVGALRRVIEKGVRTRVATAD